MVIGGRRMLMKEACEIGVACGLETLGEAVLNIKIHHANLFLNEEIQKEFDELEEDMNKYNQDDKIVDVFPDLKLRR